jgi:hypothetical protein
MHSRCPKCRVPAAVLQEASRPPLTVALMQKPIGVVLCASVCDCGGGAMSGMCLSV